MAIPRFEGRPLEGAKLKYTDHRSENKVHNMNQITLWCQLEDMFQLIVTPQGIEKVMIQLKDTPTKVYAICAKLFYQRCPQKCFKIEY